MNIGIDVSTLTKFTGGVNSYIVNLIENLAKIDGENRYFLYTHKNLETPLNLKNDRFVLRQNNNPHRLIWLQAQLPKILKKDRINVLHSPCYLVPLVSKVPAAVTIHDMTSALFPESFVLKHRLIYGTFVPLSARKAVKIIADSENTKKDIARLFSIRESKIETIHLGVDGKFSTGYSGREVGENRKKYKLDNKYILCVSTVAPRKNLVRLLESFKLLIEKKKINDYSLVIAGKRGWMCDDVFDTHKKLNLEKKVMFLDFIPEADLPLLYRGASLFVFPSLYEGFGLPPLEAMACGVPVITSNTSCFPEILQKSAIMVDPCDVNRLADEMYNVINDKGLRNELIRRGLEWVKKFTWNSTARKTLELYREIAR